MRRTPAFLVASIIIAALILVGVFLALRFSGGPTSEEVVLAFEEQGLEVGETYEIPLEGYGPVPPGYEEATRFEIPSLGRDSGGRVFTGPEDQLERVADYYRDFGAPQSTLGSWVFTSEGVVVQINGDLSRGQARHYREVVEAL